MIPIARPGLGEDEVAAASEALRSGWVSQGPRVAEFEGEFADYVGSAHACAVSSCTAALHLALLALGVGAGDEVVTVSHSFIASANSVRYCGATPVLVDIDPATFNLDPARLEAAITDRTRAVMVVHQLGMPADLDAIVAITQRHGIPLVEDAACGIGSEIRSAGKWQRIGAPHGAIAVFSFHPRKVVTTGEGGMLTTNDPRLDARFRLLRQHSMSVPDTQRHGSAEVIFEGYPELGYNYRMTDMQAAVGLVQLRKLPGFIARRRELADEYAKLLGVHGAGNAAISPPHEPEWARSNWQSYCVWLPAHVDQKRVMQRMLDAGVSTRRAVMSVHREGAYPKGAWRCARRSESDCTCSANTCLELANSEAAQDRGIILPLYPQMTRDDQVAVVEALLAAVAEERLAA